MGASPTKYIRENQTEKKVSKLEKGKPVKSIKNLLIYKIPKFHRLIPNWKVYFYILNICEVVQNQLVRVGELVE